MFQPTIATAATPVTTTKALEPGPSSLSATTTTSATAQTAIRTVSIVPSAQPSSRFANAAIESPRAS